jgi:hypothetical protein
MLFKEIFSVSFESHMEPTNTLRGQNAKNVDSGFVGCDVQLQHHKQSTTHEYPVNISTVFIERNGSLQLCAYLDATKLIPVIFTDNIY